jgi:hypothetical protein
VTAELERFALSLRPEESQYFSLGRLFLRHRLAEAALTVFFTGTQVLPQSSVLYYGLGWSFQELVKPEEAQAGPSSCAPTIRMLPAPRLFISQRQQY